MEKITSFVEESVDADGIVNGLATKEDRIKIYQDVLSDDFGSLEEETKKTLQTKSIEALKKIITDETVLNKMASLERSEAKKNEEKNAKDQAGYALMFLLGAINQQLSVDKFSDGNLTFQKAKQWLRDAGFQKDVLGLDPVTVGTKKEPPKDIKEVPKADKKEEPKTAEDIKKSYTVIGELKPSGRQSVLTDAGSGKHLLTMFAQTADGMEGTINIRLDENFIPEFDSGTCWFGGQKYLYSFDNSKFNLQKVNKEDEAESDVVPTEAPKKDDVVESDPSGHTEIEAKQRVVMANLTRLRFLKSPQIEENFVYDSSAILSKDGNSYTVKIFYGENADKKTGDDYVNVQVDLDGNLVGGTENKSQFQIGGNTYKLTLKTTDSVRKISIVPYVPKV